MVEAEAGPRHALDDFQGAAQLVTCKHRLGWNKDPSNKLYLFCLVSAKQMGPQKSNQHQKGKQILGKHRATARRANTPDGRNTDPPALSENLNTTPFFRKRGRLCDMFLGAYHPVLQDDRKGNHYSRVTIGDSNRRPSRAIQGPLVYFAMSSEGMVQHH